MFRNAVYALFAGSLIGGVVGQSQIVFDSTHNFTSITGTWTSGSRAVSTGKGFVDPQNKTFTYPKNTGISYSFSDDGFYEIARYRFNSNGSEPNCITGVVNWVHGTYDLLSNGSIVMTPFGDGFQQIQDPCAAVSNFIEDYNLTELYTSWRIFNDINDGPKLHLFQFNGAPLAPQFRLSQTPIMMPTKPLRNVTKPVAGSGQGGTGFNGQVALAQQQGGAEKVVAGLTAGLVGLVGLLAAAV